MSLSYKTTNLGFKNLKAACHEADKTVRAQILEKKTNSDYYELINTFKDITKCGALLNTSFNENEPIINIPEEALNCFLRTKMDVLVLENYLIER